MKKRMWTYVSAVMLVSVMLTGCGSTLETSMTSDMTGPAYGRAMAGGYTNEMALEEAYPVEEAAAMDTAEEEWADAGAEGGSQADIAEAVTAKKLIRNVDLEVETQEFDALLADITQEIERLGGYVENCNTSRYSVNDTWSGSITARIPSDKLDSFLSDVSESSNVIYRNESVQDVTLQYVDLDTHKKALMTERDRLMELMEKAETVEDLITIESRLSEVRYQIESMEAQLRTIDNQVSYSTVYITIQEVELLTPAADKTPWDEITEGFGNNVYRVLSGIGNFVIGLIIDIPFILLWAVVIAVFVLALRFLKMLRNKRKQKKQAKRMLKQQERGTDYEEIPPTGTVKTEETEQEMENAGK